MASSRRLSILLLIAVYNAINDLQYSSQTGPISQVAHALLYHQITLPPQSPTVLSRVSRHQANNISSEYYLTNNQHNRQAPVSGRQQQLSAQTSYLTSNGPAELAVSIAEDAYECPSECRCNKVAQIADCSDRNLTRVPNGFPKDIKRIRLERNNITEIGPFAFQGLRRLQRIDLSNNNLQNIDPLAFSGGLQSLNSLILYSNKLEQLPVNVFSELGQLQLLLLNANSLQSISKELLHSLSNLNLLSLYDNNIATLASGTFDGLKSIKTIHLGKNPLQCDCNLAWLADYLRLNPVETSEAKCESPSRAQGKKLSLMERKEFKCLADPAPSRMGPQLPPAPPTNQQQQQQIVDHSCPAGCVCNGSLVDCSKASPQSESKSGGGIYELPDVPDDVPVYVARVHINDSRIKRIRQTGLFKRLANSQKLDLGNNKIVDIEDNAINGQFTATNKPERVVFVLIENQFCSQSELQSAASSSSAYMSPQNLAGPTNRQQQQQQQQQQAQQNLYFEDPCSSAPRVNEPQFDSPCYNGGVCRPGSDGSSQQNSHNSPAARYLASYNYSCSCPVGFMGPLCEINIDDCLDHQCQNGAMCVDGINSYRCICRDPTTSGEFCEQLNPPQLASGPFSYATSSANSIAPLALPIISSSLTSTGSLAAQALAPQANDMPTNTQQHHQQQQQPLFIRSVDFSPPSASPLPPPPLQLQQQQQQQQQQPQQLLQDPQSNLISGSNQPANQLQIVPSTSGGCRRVTQRKYVDDGNGCQSVRLLKVSQCLGTCPAASPLSGKQSPGEPTCCTPARVKHRRIRMQCSDGASYMRTVELIKKCACQSVPNENQCPAQVPPTQPPSSDPIKGSQATRLATMKANNQVSAALDKYQKFNLKQQQQQQQQHHNSAANSYRATSKQFSSPMVAQEDQMMQITRLDAVD